LQSGTVIGPATSPRRTPFARGTGESRKHIARISLVTKPRPKGFLLYLDTFRSCI